MANENNGQFYHHPKVKGERKIPPGYHLIWAVPAVVIGALTLLRVIGTTVQGPIP